MKLKHLLVASLLALSATALIGCDKEDSSSDSTPPPAAPEHTHAFVKGECDCGELATPSLDVKGKTFVLKDMVAVYAEGNAPTESQEAACESYVSMMETMMSGMKLIFGTDGNVTMSYSAGSSTEEYVQKGDYITLKDIPDVSVTIENGFLLWVGAFDSEDDVAMLGGYTGLSAKMTYEYLDLSNHTHSYTQGVCACGDIQTPTVDVKGKTYVITEMTNVYDPANPPTPSQQALCEAFLQDSKATIMGVSYTFNPDGTMTIVYPKEQPPTGIQLTYTYTQAGDYVMMYMNGIPNGVMEINGTSFEFITDYSFLADPEAGLECYAGLDIKHVLTLAE